MVRSIRRKPKIRIGNDLGPEPEAFRRIRAPCFRHFWLLVKGADCVCCDKNKDQQT